MDEYLKLDEILNIERISINKVYDLSVEDNHNYFISANGDKLVHNSSKTWDFFHFLVMFYDHNRNQNLETYILRNTLVDCRDFTFKEFEKSLIKIGVWSEVTKKESPKPYVNLWGNHIYFRGLDEDKEAPPSDIIFVNEALEIDNKAKLKGWFMRCRKLQVLDWNPKLSQHWCFDLENQPNVFFTHSTYKNNKHLEKSVSDEIESYCPWHMDDLHLDEKKRRPHPINIKNGTADDYQWRVYGAGMRTAPEGIIFRNVAYIDSWPEDVAYIRGMDFGFTTDPTAVVNVGETKRDIYLELLLYEPCETPDIIDEYFKANDISKRKHIIADSSDRYVSEKNGVIKMVADMKKKGFNISKVSKTKSVMYWIGRMKQKRINIVKNNLYHYAKKEQENYRLKLVNGIAINQPVDEFNHFWDACFVGETLISTNEGLRRIDSLNVGDKVFTSNGINRINHVFNNGIKTIYKYRIELDTFSLYLHCTSDHKVKTDLGWMQISELQSGQTIYLDRNLTEKNINYIQEKGIFQEEKKGCIRMYGYTIMAKLKKAFKYIIKTKIHGIITLKISNWSKQINTYQTTLKKDIEKIRNGQQNLQEKESKLQKNGINQKRVLNGIVNTLKIFVLGLSSMVMDIASFVINCLEEKLKIKNSVRIIASQNIEEKKDLITLKKHVHLADQNSLQINLSPQKLAHINVLGSYEKRVFDLSIDNEHEYFANGMLVHNCRYGYMALNSKNGGLW